MNAPRDTARSAKLAMEATREVVIAWNKIAEV
jgi:hypothetical protein